MHRVRALWLALVLVPAAGCGHAAPPPPISEISAGARDQVLAFVEEAKRDPANARESLPALIESLDGYVAQHGADFEELRDAAGELLEAYESAADSTQVATLLDNLRDLAGDLE